ncbi:photosystem II S4 domain protein [Chondrocystis sp. NIES-4102]|nr:photosystem II S4 domain protein [Chondrocystis sp. NIES-4102]
MLPREELLKGVENKDEIVRIIDLAEVAIKNWEVVTSNFFSPPVVAEVQSICRNLTEIQVLPWGGYPQAERQRLGLARPDISLDESEIELAALDIAGNFLFDPATHRDFLGAILGTGIVRDKVGDIIVLGERGAQVIVVPEMVDFLTSSLTQVRSVAVKTQRIDFSEIKVQPPNKKEITTVEASLRLDAIASAGFGISRNKMASAIYSNDVRVNWKEITQASYNVKAGDLIAVRGKGRLEVGEVSVTKKQRYRVNLVRYK